MSSPQRQRRGGSPRGRSRLSFAQRLELPGVRFGVAAGFLLAAFLMGGGSRGDIVSLVVLRPLAFLAAGYALLQPGTARLRALGMPFWLLLALMAWTALQLVPLPHGLWSALPGRAPFAAIDAIAGVQDQARPLSLVPSRTLNTLFALAVPLAMLLLLAPLGDDQRRRLTWFVFLAAGLSFLLAALQMIGKSGGPFYLYRITNYNNPVGLFSNRNHFAIFLASVLPLLAYTASAGSVDPRRRPLLLAAALGGGFCLTFMALATGSRSGAAMVLVALVATAWLWLAHGGLARSRGSKLRRYGPVVAAIATVAVLVLVVALGSRSTTFNRLFSESVDSDLRVKILPQLIEMLRAYFPVGSGYGSFEYAYRVVEPYSILRPDYLNQAHNDALQFLIEGGLVSAALAIAFAAWFGLRGIAAWRTVAATRRARARPRVEPFAWVSLAIVLVASFADYPLRTPAMMAYAMLLCTLIAAPRASGETR